MSAAKKTGGEHTPREVDLLARMKKLEETLPEEPAPEKKRAADVIPYTPGVPTNKFLREQAREKYRPVPVLRTLADVPLEEYTWLWEGRIPEDRVSLIMGEPEAGKSTFWTYLAAVVTSGLRWPEGRRYTNRGSVLVIQSEEMVSKEVRRRVENFGGDVNKVHFMDGVIRDGGEMTTVSLAHDVPAITAALDQYGDVRMVVVDPLGEFTEGISGFNETEVRKLLRPLRRLAEERKVAVVLMAHMNKDDDADITKRLMGSVAFLGICRMSWFLSVDPFDPTRRCLSYFKGNAEDKLVTGLATGLKDGRLYWCKEPVKLHARQVDMALREQRRRETGLVRSNGPPATKIQAAMDFILAAIAAGPRLQVSVWKEASAAGVRESTFNEALGRLRGKADDEEDDLDICLVRKKTDPDGRKSKQFWLWPVVTEPPGGNPADTVSEADPLEIWLDDGGSWAGALA